MERYAHDLQEALVSGRLVASGSVELSDGLVVNLERMVRITLADFERLSSTTPDEWGAAERQQLHDDLERLHAVVADRLVTARPNPTANIRPSMTMLGLSPETVRQIIRAGTLEVATAAAPQSSAATAPSAEDASQRVLAASGRRRLSKPLASVDDELTATIAATIRATLTPVIAQLTAHRRLTERQTEEDRVRADILTRLSSDLSHVRETLRELQDLAAAIGRTTRTSVGLVAWLIVLLLGGAAWWLFRVT